VSQVFNVQYDFLFKVILIGDEEAMKEGLVTAVTSNYDTSTDYKQTIGVNFAISSLFLDDYTIKIQIWDILCGERVKYLRPLYFRGASGCIMVIKSIEEAQNYLNEIKTYCGRIIPIFFVLVSDDPIESRLNENLPMVHINRVTNGSEGIEWLASAMLSCRYNKTSNQSALYIMAPEEIRETIYNLRHMQQNSEKARLRKLREQRALQIEILSETLKEMNLPLVEDSVEILTSDALFTVNILNGKVQVSPLKCDECQNLCKRQGKLCIIEASNGWAEDLDDSSLLILSKIYALLSNALPKHVQIQIKKILHCPNYTPIH
jgi:GTPase SAR1 family protein